MITSTTKVLNINCTEWQFTAQQESGQRPSSDCHRVCLRLESGAGNDTPPFGTSLRPEEGICLMSAIPDSSACAQPHSRPKRRHLTDPRKPRCANKMRVNKVGVGLHDRRIRIDTTIIRILQQTIYNILISIIYIKMISMPYGTYWCNQKQFIYTFT